MSNGGFRAASGMGFCEHKFRSTVLKSCDLSFFFLILIRADRFVTSHTIFRSFGVRLRLKSVTTLIEIAV